MPTQHVILRPGLPIASVERETGLSKDTLRMWERRYGFPTPERDARGERLYAPEQVRRLTQIKRLMDRGHRPGRLLALDEAALAALDEARASNLAASASARLDSWLRLLGSHDGEALQRQFNRELTRRGLAGFVLDVAAPLVTRVGEAWACDEIHVFEEHLFSHQLEKLFGAALARLEPLHGSPRVLLTTLSGETHTLGLAMVEALLAAEDAHPLPLGAQTPIEEIARAAQGLRADAVCLSFSAAYSPAQAAQGLRDLRRVLPASVELWAGGHGIHPLRKGIDGVVLLPEFQHLFECLARWRDAQGGQPAE